MKRRTTAVFVVLIACGCAPRQAQPAQRTVAIQTAPEPTEATPPSVNDAGVLPTGELGVLDPMRLPRGIRLERPREYMVAEVQALEKLLEQTPLNAPDRPTLVRRIAIDYFELFLKLQSENAESITATLANAQKYFDYQVSGKNALDFYVYGLLCEVKGDFTGAERAYQEALAHSDVTANVSARAHYGRALLAERRGDTSQAQEEYERAATLLSGMGHEEPRDRELRDKVMAKVGSTTR